MLIVDREAVNKMSKPKGLGNKRMLVPETVLMSNEQRIEFLANVIVDRILEDERTGQPLLKEIMRGTG